jgi:hypothetical protein
MASSIVGRLTKVNTSGSRYFRLRPRQLPWWCADLIALYRATIDKMCGKDGEMLPGLISAFRREPELAEVLCDRVIAPILLAETP